MYFQTWLIFPSYFGCFLQNNVTLDLFSQAFITIMYSVSFIDYNSFAVYRTKRFRLRFTGDRSIFVSFDSTIISNLNFCSTILNTFSICIEIHYLTCIVIQSNSFDFIFCFYFAVFCFYLLCIIVWS